MPEEADMLGEATKKDRKKKRTPINEINNTIRTIDGSGIRYHTFSDIGTYTVFPAQMSKRLFPSKVYGKIESDEVKNTGTLGIMCREQGLRITSDLARMTLPKDRNIDYPRLAHEMTSSEMVKLELLTDENSYTALVQDFSLSL